MTVITFILVLGGAIGALLGVLLGLYLSRVINDVRRNRI